MCVNYYDPETHYDATYHCRVCGMSNYPYPVWGDDGKTPDSSICACCGVTEGSEDTSPKSAQAYRQTWLDKGAPWHDLKFKADDWDLAVQLKHIPPDFR